jgi:hypothetical protein
MERDLGYTFFKSKHMDLTSQKRLSLARNILADMDNARQRIARMALDALMLRLKHIQHERLQLERDQFRIEQRITHIKLEYFPTEQ